MIQIIPAILATTEEEYKEAIEKISNSKSLKNGWLHIDFADNKFVQNQTIDSSVLKKYSTDLNLEAHLMVEEPNNWIASLKDAGVKRAIAHVETEEEDVDDFVAQCKVLNMEVGMAIKIETPLEKLDPYWEVADLILVMSIELGFQGQPFKAEAINRIKEIKKICSNFDKPFMIGVDGHVDNQTAKSLINAGVEQLVVGSFLLKGNLDENLEKIWKAAKG